MDQCSAWQCISRASETRCGRRAVERGRAVGGAERLRAGTAEAGLEIAELQPPEGWEGVAYAAMDYHGHGAPTRLIAAQVNSSPISKRKRQTAPAASMESLTQRLEGAARAALKRVLADASERKLQSALTTTTCFAEFAALCPEREPLFMDAKFQGDRQAALYNAWTMTFR